MPGIEKRIVRHERPALDKLLDDRMPSAVYRRLVPVIDLRSDIILLRRRLRERQEKIEPRYP